MSQASPGNGTHGSARVHVISLKKGASHGLWQYKVPGTHERVMMHGLHRILDRSCEALGLGSRDRSAVFRFHFSVEPFEGFQVCLEKVREAADGGCSYRVRSAAAAFAATGSLPAAVRSSYLGDWPEAIYFKMEKSMTGQVEG